MAASLLGAGCLLAGSAAPAQETSRPQASPYSSWRLLVPAAAPQPTSLATGQGHSSGVKAPATMPAATATSQAEKAVSPTPATAQTFTYRKPANPPAPAVQPTAFQQPPAGAGARVIDQPQTGYQPPLEPPGPERLFGRLESESALLERWRQEARDRPTPERLVFPEEPILSKTAYAGRKWPPLREVVEPNYVCYGRLFFEEKNSERYGWEIGFMQPFISTAYFFADVVTLPYDWAKDPLRCYECNAGYCLPGSPVPYVLYPPGCSATGLVGEAGAIIALFFIFP